MYILDDRKGSDADINSINMPSISSGFNDIDWNQFILQVDDYCFTQGLGVQNPVQDWQAIQVDFYSMYLAWLAGPQNPAEFNKTFLK